jgi:hypothetical protein
MSRVRPRARPILVLGLVAAAGLAAACLGWANDRHVPRAEVSVSGTAKRLSPWSVEWVKSGRHHMCSHESVDGIPSFRPRVGVDHGHVTPRVILHKRQRPRRVIAYADNRLANGYLAHAKRVPVDLRARHRHGHRYWVAVMRAHVKHRLLFAVTGFWRDVEGCGGRESAGWSFGLVRRS